MARYGPFFGENSFSPADEFVFMGLVVQSCHFDVTAYGAGWKGQIVKEMISAFLPRPKPIFLGETAQLSIRSQNGIGENDLSWVYKQTKLNGPKALFPRQGSRLSF